VGVSIVLEDEAKQVDPDQIKSRDLDEIRPGGLGVHIIRELMDEVRYERREHAGMRLTMIKRIAPAAPGPANGAGAHTHGGE
jgi:anti-sigma regulatory factor (Ser/Thr protein kinase)